MKETFIRIQLFFKWRAFKINRTFFQARSSVKAYVLCKLECWISVFNGMVYRALTIVGASVGIFQNSLSKTCFSGRVSCTTLIFLREKIVYQNWNIYMLTRYKFLFFHKRKMGQGRGKNENEKLQSEQIFEP